MNHLPDADPPRPPEEFSAPTIRFIGEQDGPPERELKSHLAKLLSSEQSVHRAYLARLQYGDATSWDVALCIAAANPNVPEVNGRVGRLFAGIFRRDVHLDVLYLTSGQESQLSAVCRPFFSAC